MSKPNTASLSKRPALIRFATGPGMSARPEGKKVDREGGHYKAGLIPGVAVITRGEALGHAMFIDATTLQQVADGVNANALGVKSHFTHPSLSGDGTGKVLGRAMTASVDGDVVRGDLHLANFAKRSPEGGDLSGYVMDLVDEDPELLGNSIQFQHDIAAEDAFVEAHGGKVLPPEIFGPGAYDLTDFKSPDPKNTRNLFHVRIAELRGVDVVDDPAANPTGMFHRGQEIPTEADSLCEYAFGLSDVRPGSAALGIDPDRLRGFASRFLSARGLAVAKQGAGGMPQPGTNLTTGTETTPPDDTTPPAGETPPATGTPPAGDSNDGAAGGGGTTPPEGSASPAGNGDADPKAAALAAFRADLAKFSALDPIHGPKWLSEGKTFEEAQGLAITALQADRAGLQTKLTAALAAAGGEPLDGGHDGGSLPSRSASGLTDGQARFASAIKLPGPSRN